MLPGFYFWEKFLQAGREHQQIVVEVAVGVGADVGLFALGADHQHDGTLASARIQDKKSVVAGVDAANDLRDGPLPSVSPEMSDVLVGALGIRFSDAQHLHVGHGYAGAPEF